MEFKSKLLCNSRACPSRLCSQKAETCDKQRVHEFRILIGPDKSSNNSNDTVIEDYS